MEAEILPMKTVLNNLDFGNEAGDDVLPDEIESFFVEQEDFSKFQSDSNRIMLATAKKGVGKSALLRWLEYKVSGREDCLVIACKGKDLVRSNFPIKTTPQSANEYINDWMQRICILISREIAKGIGLALDDDSITLVEAAEIDGFRRRNLVTALTDRFRLILGRRFERTNHGDLANPVELLKRRNFSKVWLLVDDLDATYQRTAKENLELSTFFAACRYLASEVGGIIFRVTMRTDVWPMIRRFDEALDKTEQYVHEITWSQADFRRLLHQRIKSQVDALRISIPPPPEHVTQEEIEEYLINLIFQKRMPWADQERRTYKVLYTLSYHRPRWAIQLCKLAQSEAIRRKAELIEKEDIDSVWGHYGKKRIEDLIVEHKHQSQDVEEMINGFRGAERRMTRPDLLAWIKNHITNHMTPVIEGRPTKAAIEIGHFLYRLGFLQARIEEADGNYEHYSFADMPDFLTNRTNHDFKAIWEIHPCYREALDITKLNQWQSRNRGLSR